MRTQLTVITFCLVAGACGVSTQDEPEPLGTPATGSAPTPTVTQRPDQPPVSISNTTPTTSTAVTPVP